MKFVEISGADTGGVLAATEQALAAERVTSPDHVDAATDKGTGALSAVRTLSMFEPSRVVVVSTPEKVSVAVARDMAKLTHEGALIFVGEKPVTAAVRKALPGLAAHRYPLPRAGEAAGWVKKRFEEQGIQLPPGGLPGLSEIAVTATGASRIRHVAELLTACGLAAPGQDILDNLTHDLGASEAVWAASDATTRGDVATARPSLEVEPIVALSMLTRRLARLAAVLEGEADTSELADLFDTREGAVRMLSQGVRVPAADVARAFEITVQAAALCRRLSDPVMSRAAAEVASIRAAEILHGT